MSRRRTGWRYMAWKWLRALADWIYPKEKRDGVP